MVSTFSKRKQGRKVSYKYKKSIFTNVNLHANSSKSNSTNTSNIDIVVGNSNLPHINVQTESSFNKLINLQLETDSA